MSDQQLKCLKGEHEPAPGILRGVYLWVFGDEQQAVSLCKHCRCLFVEKEDA